MSPTPTPTGPAPIDDADAASASHAALDSLASRVEARSRLSHAVGAFPFEGLAFRMLVADVLAELGPGLVTLEARELGELRAEIPHQADILDQSFPRFGPYLSPLVRHLGDLLPAVQRSNRPFPSPVFEPEESALRPGMEDRARRPPTDPEIEMHSTPEQCRETAASIKQIAEGRESGDSSSPPHPHVQKLGIGDLLSVLDDPAVSTFLRGVESDVLARFIALVSSYTGGNPAPAA